MPIESMGPGPEQASIDRKEQNNEEKEQAIRKINERIYIDLSQICVGSIRNTRYDEAEDVFCPASNLNEILQEVEEIIGRAYQESWPVEQVLDSINGIEVVLDLDFVKHTRGFREFEKEDHSLASYSYLDRIVAEAYHG